MEEDKPGRTISQQAKKITTGKPIGEERQGEGPEKKKEY